MKFVFGRVENILGNGKNAGYLHFSPLSHPLQVNEHWNCVAKG